MGARVDAERLGRARRDTNRARTRVGAVVALVVVAYLYLLGVVVLDTAITAAALVVMLGAIPWVRDLILVPPPDESLRGVAQRYHDRLRFAETRSEEWTSELSSTAGRIANRREVSRAVQPWTMPELIAAFRDFVARIVAERPVIIGIDELDKIASVEEAQRLLNEIKALFGQRGVYYIVTLSDDAMSAFETRGLPLRDVFESVFDDVLHVPALTLTESERVLHERTIGIAPPFVGVCHALSGGLPRELIRIAREAVAAAGRASDPNIATVVRSLLEARGHARRRAAEVIAARSVAPDGRQAIVSWLREWTHVGAVGESLHDTAAVTVVVRELRAELGDAVAPLELLVLEFATASYHATSIMEFFGSLNEDIYEEAKIAGDDAPSPIERLTAATRDLAVAPSVAWETTSLFREAVGQSRMSYPLAVEADAALS